MLEKLRKSSKSTKINFVLERKSTLKLWAYAILKALKRKIHCLKIIIIILFHLHSLNLCLSDDDNVMQNVSTTYYNEIHFIHIVISCVSCVCKPFLRLCYSMVGVYALHTFTFKNS